MKIKRTASNSATIMGILVALANGWITIDWKDFDIKKEYPKLILSAIIALGGYFSTLKNFNKNEIK